MKKMWSSEELEEASSTPNKVVVFFLSFLVLSCLFFQSFMLHRHREILIKTTTGIHSDSEHDPTPDLLPPILPSLRLPI